jgi:hypothetical protein
MAVYFVYRGKGLWANLLNVKDIPIIDLTYNGMWVETIKKPDNVNTYEEIIAYACSWLDDYVRYGLMDKYNM